MKPHKDFGAVPESDKYFLGRLILNEKGINDKRFLDRSRKCMFGRVLDRFNIFYKIIYLPDGFMQLVFLINRSAKLNYAFNTLPLTLLYNSPSLTHHILL